VDVEQVQDDNILLKTVKRRSLSKSDVKIQLEKSEKKAFKENIFSSSTESSGGSEEEGGHALRNYYRENILKNKGHLELSYEEEINGKYTKKRNRETKR
jgi:hypothetical protein